MNFFNLSATYLSPIIVLLNIIFSFALQLAIVWIYKKTHRGLSYSQGFIFSLVIVGVLGTMIMMIVQNNLVGAFALLGAFSLIRFRTILKETRDVAFVFFSLTIGIAVGTGFYSVAVIGLILLSLMIFIMDRYHFGSIVSGLGFLLTITTKGKLNSEFFKGIFKNYALSYELLRSRSHEDGTWENIFSLVLKDDFSSGNLMEEIQKQSGIIDIDLITSKHSVEY